MSFWTKQVDARLRELIVDDKKSHSEAAAILNAEFRLSFSRNACIGRARRLNFPPIKPGSKWRPSMIRKPRPVTVSSERKRIRRNGDGYVAATIKEYRQNELRLADVIPRHVSLMDLQPNECRYPYGEGPFTFCGCQTIEGLSYCAPHYALCWSPVRSGDSESNRQRKRAYASKMRAEAVAA